MTTASLYDKIYVEYLNEFERDICDEFLTQIIIDGCKIAASKNLSAGLSGAYHDGGSGTIIKELKAFIKGYKYAMGTGERIKFK